MQRRLGAQSAIPRQRWRPRHVRVRVSVPARPSRAGGPGELGPLGAAAACRVDFNSRPSTREPRRRLRPTIAAGDSAARVAAVLSYRAFHEAYRAARERLIKGLSALFPPGTYWLRRNAGVVASGKLTSDGIVLKTNVGRDRAGRDRVPGKLTSDGIVLPCPPPKMPSPALRSP